MKICHLFQMVRLFFYSCLSVFSYRVYSSGVCVLFAFTLAFSCLAFSNFSMSQLFISSNRDKFKQYESSKSFIYRLFTKYIAELWAD